MDDGYVSRNELDEQVSEWIEGLAGCQETGKQWNGLDLYTGAMCSPHGDGVELAVFANDECTWYTKKAFQDYYNPYAEDDNGNNVNYLMYAEDFIKSAFSEVTPCMQQEFDDADEEEDENNDNEEEEGYEVNDYCKEVMEGDAISFNACEAEEEEEEEEEQDENAADYSWFTYDIKEADDVEQVCAALNKLEDTDYSNYHVYDEETSGTWYKRNRKGAIVQESESEGLSGGAVSMIVLLVLGVVGAAGFAMTKAKKNKAVDTEYQGGAMS